MPGGTPGAAGLILAPCSIGDLLDRITILRLKRARCRGDLRAHVVLELSGLEALWVDEPEMADLAEVNLALWEVEDQLRAFEASGTFDAAFIAAARSVYRLNDRRASLKRAVNARLGSQIVEVKVHPEYR
ncbi:MAG: hypothetical protein EXR69_04970 [Myxococcales bacterium]|nr:hypothetical protein [Myxococcales bacterium]